MSAVAENIQTVMPDPIVFTDSAAAKVADLIAEEGNPDLKLRVFVQGGGCSGFSYGFTFDEITNEDDTTMSKNGVSLLIDAMSYQYLTGAEIDSMIERRGKFVHQDIDLWWRLVFLSLILHACEPSSQPFNGGKQPPRHGRLGRP